MNDDIYIYIYISATGSYEESKEAAFFWCYLHCENYRLPVVISYAVFQWLTNLNCCSKAIERASKNQAIIEAIGEPIERGPWYNASLAVAHKRQSVSCTFPVSGPQGTGIFQLKAVRNGGLFHSL